MLTEQIKGKWDGFYAYDAPRIKKTTGFGQTFFTIEINETNGCKFSGTVQDDVATGGMEELGIIEGELDGGIVFFRKRMPVNSAVLQDGRRIKRNRPHPVIHYRGEYFPIEKKMQGVWKIKGRIFFHDRKLYVSRRCTGTWEMTLVNEKK